MARPSAVSGFAGTMMLQLTLAAAVAGAGAVAVTVGLGEALTERLADGVADDVPAACWMAVCCGPPKRPA